MPLEFLADIPEVIAGEPPPLPHAGGRFAVELLLLHVLLVISGLVGLLAWPLYLVVRCFWGRPPITPPFSQFCRYAQGFLTARPSAPGLSPIRRYVGLLNLARKYLWAPVWGLCWFLDAAIYGGRLRRVKLERPLFEISAGRSGSTQLAHYLEDDPRIAAPTVLQAMFPFVWMWKLAGATLGRMLPPERVRAMMRSSLPPAFLQRHEIDPFRTDTFELCMYTRHFIEFSPLLGPDMMLADFSLSRVRDHNRQLWEGDFIDFIDAIGRKTLYQAGSSPDGGAKRLMVKGHFLASAAALERRYPDACFLTMIREPAPRMQSGINFLRVGPTQMGLGPPPWAWLVRYFVEAEAEYSEREMDWYQRPGGARKCVLRFKDYIRDLEFSLRKVYGECFDSPELPPHAPTTHEPRQRTNYLVDRSLEQLGVDVPALNARLADYIAWCKGPVQPAAKAQAGG